MRKFFLLLGCCLCFLLQQAQPVKTHGQLQVRGTSLVDATGNDVVLKGVSFGWHNLWPRFYNAGAVHELVTRWNAMVIRAAMGIQLNDSGYLKSPERSEQLMKKVIDQCIQEGVYVIIDWHDHNIHAAQANTFFSRMAKQYSSYPNIIYEVYNEPDYETWPEVKTYAEAIIKTIRTYDAKNIILVGSPHWDQDIHLPAADPITGYTNLMYTMHFYAGTHKQGLRDRTDSAIQTGLPVFISECAGMEASGNGPLDAAEWQQWVAWMDRRRLSWLAWSLSDKAETCSMLKPAAAANGNWKEADTKEWGEIVKTYLKKNGIK